MAKSTYVAWDGNRYEWPPPAGWYEADDDRWWPEGYGPASEETQQAATTTAVGTVPHTPVGEVVGLATPASQIDTGGTSSSGSGNGTHDGEVEQLSPVEIEAGATSVVPAGADDDDLLAALGLSLDPDAAGDSTGQHYSYDELPPIDDVFGDDSDGTATGDPTVVDEVAFDAAIADEVVFDAAIADEVVADRVIADEALESQDLSNDAAVSQDDLGASAESNGNLEATIDEVSDPEPVPELVGETPTDVASTSSISDSSNDQQAAAELEAVSSESAEAASAVESRLDPSEPSESDPPASLGATILEQQMFGEAPEPGPRPYEERYSDYTSTFESEGSAHTTQFDQHEYPSSDFDPGLHGGDAYLDHGVADPHIEHHVGHEAQISHEHHVEQHHLGHDQHTDPYVAHSDYHDHDQFASDYKTPDYESGKYDDGYGNAGYSPAAAEPMAFDHTPQAGLGHDYDVQPDPSGFNHQANYGYEMEPQYDNAGSGTDPFGHPVAPSEEYENPQGAGGLLVTEYDQQAPAPAMAPSQDHADWALGDEEEGSPKNRTVLWLVGALSAVVLVVAIVYFGLIQGSESDEVTPADPESEGASPDKADRVGGSENPYPAGTVVLVFYPKAPDSQHYEWQVAALAGTTDASAELADLGGPALAPGEVLVQTRLRVLYTSGPADGSLSDLTFVAVDADGVEYDASPEDCAVVGQGLSNDLSLRAGQAVEGDVCWRVPAEARENILLGIQAAPVQGTEHIQLD